VGYDAIVIGAGHNGLTAATVMARDGMQVLLLEKNQYTGGMAATTELIRGYRHEIAGSILFPVPDEIYESLRLAEIGTLEPEVQSVNLGSPTDPPMLFWSDPDTLMNHLLETMGMEAVLGLAEIAAWCEAPARALGRHEVRTEPKTLDDMFACAANEREHDAIRTAMFGSVMDVIDRYLPDKERCAVLRGMLAFLSVNSTYRGPYTPGSAMCLAFAMATGGRRMLSKIEGGIGRLCDHVLKLFLDAGGELRLHAKVEEITTAENRVTGVRLTNGETIAAPVVVANLDPTMTFTRLLGADVVPDDFRARVDGVAHQAPYLQIHFALDGLPEFAGDFAIINEGVRRASVSFFSPPEEMQRDYEGCLRGEIPQNPSFGLQIPSVLDAELAPPGKHAASAFAMYLPVVGTQKEQNAAADEMTERVIARVAQFAPNFPDIIERKLVYPSYTYELMFGATGGDFCHGLLQPEHMGPFRPGPRGWLDRPIPVKGLFLSSSGCHGGPGVTFIPGYNAGHAVISSLHA
jgi:phytoene dehydrogenase-like protein